jgi:G3E family GTPase
LPIEKVLNVGGFNLERAVEVDAQFLETEYPFEWAGAYELAAGTHELAIGHHGHDHEGHDHDHECGEACGHDHNSLDVVVAPVRSANPVDLEAVIKTTVLAFSDWEKATPAGETITADGKMHRLKLHDEHGHFPVKIEKPGHYVLFTGHDVPTHLHAPGGEMLRYGWDKTFRHEHSHDEEVSSVGIGVDGELDGKKLNDWISKLLQTKGGDIFRMKGVLVVKGTKKRLVFQGVHMLFDAKFDREWKNGENRTNTLVFIGKNLDRAALTEGFKACLT